MRKYALILVFAVILSLTVVGVAGAQGGGVHHVRYGDTLYSIAARYGVSVEAIMQANGMYNPNMIYAGQALRIPGGYGGGYGYAPAPGCANVHTVIPGETLSGIAYHYGIPMQEIMTRNNFYNRDMVYVGQTICMPGGSFAPAPSYPAYAPPPAIEEVVVLEKQVAPAYAPPPAPPPAPLYGGGDGPTYKKVEKAAPPAAPEYQPSPAKPLLPLANHPIEVVVNGGEIWRGEVYPSSPDPDQDTVLIVSTRESDKPTVMLRSGDYEVKGELGLVPEFGVDQYRFAFRFIPPGDFDVWLVDPEGVLSEKVPVKVEAGKRVEVNFTKGVGFSGPTFASPSGWILANWDNPSQPGQNIGSWSNILVRTPASGLWVLIESEGGGYQAKCFTGTKGPGACDFAGLSAGLYYIHIDGTDLTLKTYMDGAAYAEFEFGRQPTSLPEDRDKVGPVSYSN